jgi:hypothetical protein
VRQNIKPFIANRVENRTIDLGWRQTRLDKLPQLSLIGVVIGVFAPGSVLQPTRAIALRIHDLCVYARRTKDRDFDLRVNGC